MPAEPDPKRAVAFFDGQNLFYAAKEAFGYPFPNYDPMLLTETVCRAKGWQAEGIRFYTGVHSANDNPFWNHFWTAKMAVMGTRGIQTFSRSLRYRDQTVTLPDGTLTVTIVGQEKGVDVRIALDIVRLALDGRYDVALIFSQDQDLSEAVRDVYAFPVSPTVTKARGINGTDWIRIVRGTFDSCIDPNDYRPKRRDV